MKAKDYFNQFLNENQDQSVEWRLVHALREMFIEIKTIATKRQAQSDSALIAIIKEVETKSKSFIHLVNEIEPFKSEGTIKKDAFRLFVTMESPTLAALVWGETTT